MTKRNKYITAVCFLLPAVLLYSLLEINPIIQSIYLSFFSWKGIPNEPLVFVGLKNFFAMFESSEFWRSLGNSGWFILVAFVVQLPLSFLLASIVTSRMKGVRFFKTAYFMPVILPITAIGIIWTNILYPNGGVLNTFLEGLGLHSWALNWLGDKSTATLSIALVACWVSAGLNMIIIAAGMVAIPEELYECGKLEGATGFKKIRYITLPLLSETLKVYAILAITGSLKVFDIIYVMTRGGPNRASESPAMLLYNESFKYNNFGYGSSLGTFILVVGIVISIILNKVFYTRDE